VELPRSTDQVDLEALYAEYEKECRDRSQQMLASARRPVLEQALSDRRRAEADYDDAVQRVDRARHGLETALAAIGETVDDEIAMVAALEGWMEQARSGTAAADAARAGRARLDALLDGGTLEDLEQIAEKARVRV